MERDEAGALARLQAILREIFVPEVAANGGRIVKLMGDGALIEFASVVAAVRCALEVQAALAERNGAAAEGERVLYRIGVNAGDVIVEGDDIFGEGVNVAARLQTLAQPGGVALSRTVRDQIAGRIEAEFDDLGEHQVKDIEKPLHVFAVRVGAAAPTELPRAAAGISVCVLPFVNMSGDPEQEYFSDGVTEDIITDLSKVSSLAVTSRNTAFTFKGKTIAVPNVVRQLRVTHVLEGSVRRAGDRVRITAQLIEGATDNHVWAERYDRDLKDIFALQDEIAQSIVGALKLKLAPAEKKAIELRSTTNPLAYKIYLMARQFSMTAHMRHRALVVNLCQKAVEIDPNYARAWALMAIAQSNVALFDIGDAELAWEASERALALDPDLAEAYSARGRVLGDHGRLDEARPLHDRALQLDRDSYLVNCAAARCAVPQRRFDDAVVYLERATAMYEDDIWAAGMLIQCFEALDNPGKRLAAARHALARTERLIAHEPDHALALSFGVGALVVLGEIERAKEWAWRAILVDPENHNMTYNIGCSMIRAGEVEWGLDLVEKTIRASIGLNLNWVRTDNDLDAVREHPRFKAMMAEATAKEEAALR